MQQPIGEGALSFGSVPGNDKMMELTIMPKALRRQHPSIRLAYRTRPFSKYGQPTLAANDGAILQNAMMPLGVDGGTRSRAADKMMT